METAHCKIKVNDKVHEVSGTIGVFLSKCDPHIIDGEHISYDERAGYDIKLVMIKNKEIDGFLLECINIKEETIEPPEGMAEAIKEMLPPGLGEMIIRPVQVNTGNNVRFLFCKSLRPAMKYMQDMIETQRELAGTGDEK